MSIFQHHVVRSTVALSAIAICAACANAALIAQHIGGANPTTEGWTFNDYTGLGGVFTSGSDSEAHWRVAPNANSTGRYLFPLSQGQVTDPTGWTLTVRAKLNAADRVNQAYFGVDDGPSPATGSLWSLHLVNQPGNSGVYQLIHSDTQGPSVSAVDPSLGYHTYNISYDPDGDNGNGAVTYYMDGAVVGSQTRATAQIQSVRRIEWGDTWNAGGASDSQFSLVQFETGRIMPPAQPLPVDVAAGEPFDRRIFGQNAHAGSYITEGYLPAYEKNISILNRTSIRGVAGGSYADSYNWKTLFSSSTPAVRPDGQAAKGESTLELLRMARDNGSDLVVTVNETGLGAFAGDGTFHYTDTSASTLASQAKDWVRYTNHILQTYRQGDVITDPEDQRILNELDWANTDFRADKLLAPGESPVPMVTYWEIGNEVDYYDSPSIFRSRYRAITQAMLQADPTIKVGPSVTGAVSGNAGPYLHELLRDHFLFGLEQVDFVTYHPYGYQVLSIDENADHAAVSHTLDEIKANQVWERDWVRNRISNAGRDPDDIELLATEWNPTAYDNTWRFRQYNGLGVVETAMTFAEMGLSAANFWVWPSYINTGAAYSQFFAFDALTRFGGDTLVESYTEDNLRVYVTRDSVTGTVAVWGLNFAFGDPLDATMTFDLTLDNLGIDADKVTLMRLADSGGQTTLLSSHLAGTTTPSVDWNTTDVTGADLSHYLFAIKPAELTLLVIEQNSATPGDFNRNGTVDGVDLAIWQTNFPTTSGATVTSGDADADLDVDGNDFLIWQSHFEVSSSNASPVPEPSTASLALLVVVCITRRKSANITL